MRIILDGSELERRFSSDPNRIKCPNGDCDGFIDLRNGRRCSRCKAVARTVKKKGGQNGRPKKVTIHVLG